MKRLALALAAVAVLAPAATWAFTTNDPLASRQVYLRQDRAFDAFREPPSLRSVSVAILDSGIDGGHPEFAGQIIASKSFVGGSALTDQTGHGTFVAGEIAANANNGVGIAGIAISAQLIVAKVARPDGSVSSSVEARAIEWAVRRGARVINLSFGALRDPASRGGTYSRRERRAIDFATRNGVLVVASVGNGDGAPAQPWPYASYPAALPHVLGVSAYGPTGTVPLFSNRDRVFNDVSAPGVGIFSTFPRALTRRTPACVEQGYSSCGTAEYRRGNGTSFAAPQVTAAAAVLLGLAPGLQPNQLASLLERSASDATSANGCSGCRTGRDALTGWGRLDIAAAVGALRKPFPPPDRLEPNDGFGASALTVRGRSLRVTATVDPWDDPIDVYRIFLRPNEEFSAHIVSHGPHIPRLSLLNSPGPTRGRGAWHYFAVRPAAGGYGSYTLTVGRR